MTDPQPDALALADKLERIFWELDPVDDWRGPLRDAAQELRRLTAALDDAQAEASVARVAVEELRAEVAEQARIIGMGAERELALMGERDRLRAEVQALRAENEALSNAADWETP